MDAIVILEIALLVILSLVAMTYFSVFAKSWKLYFSSVELPLLTDSKSLEEISLSPADSLSVSTCNGSSEQSSSLGFEERWNMRQGLTRSPNNIRVLHHLFPQLHPSGSNINHKSKRLTCYELAAEVYCPPFSPNISADKIQDSVVIKLGELEKVRDFLFPRQPSSATHT